MRHKNAEFRDGRARLAQVGPVLILGYLPTSHPPPPFPVSEFLLRTMDLGKSGMSHLFSLVRAGWWYGRKRQISSPQKYLGKYLICIKRNRDFSRIWIKILGTMFALATG
jgi:hypothetical protein